MNRKPLNFSLWINKGITHLKHIFHNNTLISFPHLVQKYSIGENQFLEFLQIKSSIQTKINIKSSNLDLSTLTSDLVNITTKKKLLSNIYKIISTSDQAISIPSKKWEQDLQIIPSTDFWTQICKNIFSISQGN